jgi:hypothetical protein
MPRPLPNVSGAEAPSSGRAWLIAASTCAGLLVVGGAAFPFVKRAAAPAEPKAQPAEKPARPAYAEVQRPATAERPLDDESYKTLLTAAAVVRAQGRQGGGALVHAGRRLVVTALQVVGDAAEVTVYFPSTFEGKVLTSRRDCKARAVLGRVVQRDAKLGLALVQLDLLPAGPRPLPLARVGAEAGAAVHAASSPTPSDLFRLAGGQVKQAGQRDLFLAEGRVIIARVLEVQGALTFGDVGGPVIDDKGAMVGVVCSASCAVEAAELRGLLDGYLRSVGDRYVEPPEPVVERPKPRPVDVADLVLQLGDADAGKRAAAARALGERGAEARQALNSLFRLLGDADAGARAAAVEALRKVGTTAAERDDLVRALGSRHADVLVFAVEALGPLAAGGTDVPVETVVGLLGNADAAVRRSAAAFLEGLPAAKVRPAFGALADLLSGPDAEAAALAERLILRQAPFGAAETAALERTVLIGKTPEARLMAATLLLPQRNHPEAAAVLAEALGGDDRARRAVAVARLSRLSAKELSASASDFTSSRKHLVRALDGDDAQARYLALTILAAGRMPVEDAAPAVFRCCRAAEAPVRQAAARLLPKLNIKDKEVLAQVKTLASSADAVVSRTARQVLAGTPEGAAEAVAALLKTCSDAVGDDVQTEVDVDPDSGAETVRRVPILVYRNKAAFDAAVDDLVRIGEPAVRELARTVQSSKYGGQRMAAAMAFCRMGTTARSAFSAIGTHQPHEPVLEIKAVLQEAYFRVQGLDPNMGM